jgi:hypothetical protein
MRPLHLSGGGIPPGYVLESAAIAHVSKRSLSVGREAQCIYGPGQPIVLFQDGKAIPASVVKQVYNGTVTTITVNVAVNSTIVGVAYDASYPVAACADTYLQQIFHLDSLPLYDSGPSPYPLSLVGTAPTLVAGKFGNSFQMAAKAYYYNRSSPLSGIMSLGHIWSVDCWVYGQPVGYMAHGYYSASWGYNQAYLYFGAGGVPQGYSHKSNSAPSYDWSATSSIACVDGQWNHVAWCWDVNGFRRIYVNGALGVSSDQLGASRNMCGFYALFGAGNVGDAGWSNGSASFNGIVDELRIINGACLFNGPFAVPTKPGGPDFR